MSGRIDLSFVDFITLSPESGVFVAFCRGRFWCETGAVTQQSRNGRTKVETSFVRLKTRHGLGAFGSDTSQRSQQARSRHQPQEAISAFAKVSPDREKTNKKVI